MYLSPEELRLRFANHEPNQISPNNGLRWASVSAIFRRRENLQWELLFIKRAAHEHDPWSGHMAFPGGRVDPDDPHPKAAAIRETREEVGIDLELHGRFLAQLHDVQASARGARVPLVVRPFVWMLERDLPLTPNDEVADTVWIPLEFLLSDAGLERYPYVYQNVPIQLPCIRFSDYVVWGLTYHMLQNLLELLRKTT